MPARSRVLKAACLALLAGHLAASLPPALTQVRNDFPSYYLSARAVLEGRSLADVYERAFWREERARAGLPTAGTFVPFPPPNALLLLPFAWMGAAGAKAAWVIALVLALIGSFLALRRVVPEAWPWLAALAILTQTASLRNALLYGQPYPLLLLLLAGSLVLLARGRPFAAGLALAPVLALKLYALPFVLFLVLSRRWRAVLGAAAGVAALVSLSVAVLGPEVHRAYVTQVLRESLQGRILDPYSTVWGSPASVAHRLFQAEPELNPRPVVDAPLLARAVGTGAGAFLALAAAACAAALDRAGRLRRAWATLAMGSLAASPLPSTYHMVLLALPVAVLVAEAERPWERWASLALGAFAGSPLVHYAAPLAQGWGNLVAPARLLALMALLVLCVRRIAVGRPAALAAAGAVLAGLAAIAGPTGEDGWLRLAGARGLILAEPAVCRDGLSWRVVLDGSYAFRWPDGTIASEPACVPSTTSPDGSWVTYALFSDGSWDVWVRHTRTGETRRVTRDPANEMEPAWLLTGDAIVFASDRRRGLGATTLFVVPFAASASPRPAAPRP